MARIRNMVGSFIIIGALVSLLLTAWNGGFVDNYSVTEADNDASGQNIFERLNNLNLIQGVNSLTIAIQKLTTISNPGDLLGGLAIAGTGVLQIIGGIITIPFEIFGVIGDFYDIPDMISILLGAMVVISVGFILLSAKLRYDL